MAVIGKDPIPTGFDAINTGGCDFGEPISSVRIELWQCDPRPWDGCTTGAGYESQVAVVPVPGGGNVLPFPFDDLRAPLIDTGLPDGTYHRQVTAITPEGNAIHVPGMEDVHLVRDPGSLQADLLQHLGRWMRLGVADYTYTGVYLCACPPEYRAIVHVTVRDGRIAGVTPEDPAVGSIPEPERYLVENVFDLLQDAVTRNADRISVDYHERAGYPETFLITYDYQATGDEVGGALRDLTPLRP